MTDPRGDLSALFETLAPARDSQSGEVSCINMVARPVPGFERHRLARMLDGSPTLLLAVADEGERGRPAAVELEHLSVQHDVTCRLFAPSGAVEEGRFTIVRCSNSDRVLRAYFLRAVGTALLALGPRPTRAEVACVVDSLVELFRALSQPPRKSVQGVWAEMLLIANARDVAAMVRAWHAALGDRYDFNAGGERLEVKSVSGRLRRHHFALEQLQPPEGTRLLIASLFIERAGAGTSLRELVDEVREHLNDTELLLKVERVLAQTLGEGLRGGLESRFDRQLAVRSLAFYSPSAIPSVDSHLPPSVSEVRFQSDLSSATPVETAQRRGGLFDAL